MRRPPRDPAERLFSIRLILPSVIYGGIAFALLCALQVAGTYWGFSPDRVRALVFVSLVGSIMALALVTRSFSASLGRAVWRHNLTLRYVGTAVVIGCFSILAFAPLRDLLGFAPLASTDLPFLLLTPATTLLLCEIVKGYGLGSSFLGEERRAAVSVKR